MEHLLDRIQYSHYDWHERTGDRVRSGSNRPRGQAPQSGGTLCGFKESIGTQTWEMNNIHAYHFHNKITENKTNKSYTDQQSWDTED